MGSTGRSSRGDPGDVGIGRAGRRGGSPATPSLRPDSASRMVGRRLACRDALGLLGPLKCGWTTVFRGPGGPSARRWSKQKSAAVSPLGPSRRGSWSGTGVGAGRCGLGPSGVVGGGSVLCSSRGAFRPRDVHFALERALLTAPLEGEMHRSSAKCTPRHPVGAGPVQERSDRRGRRPRRGPRRRRLSESVAKTRIAPKRRRRIVDIPRFCSPQIPPRDAFATDSDTPPFRTAPGAPPAPPRARPAPSPRRSRPIRRSSW